MQTIEALFEQLNYPGAARLKQALKNRGIPYTNLQVEKLAKGETVRQIQQAAPPLKGKVASHYMGYEFQADLIDWTSTPSGANKKKGEKYILVVQDVFSRFIWAEPLASKRPDEVLQAFKRVLAKAEEEGIMIPNRLTTDAGGEFVDVKNICRSKTEPIELKRV